VVFPKSFEEFIFVLSKELDDGRGVAVFDQV